MLGKQSLEVAHLPLQGLSVLVSEGKMAAGRLDMGKGIDGAGESEYLTDWLVFTGS